MRLRSTAALLLALVVWIHAPALAAGDLLGAPKTDVLRAVWGFDHQARGFPLPFWTDRVGFPGGVKLLVLPVVSSMLGAPLHWLFGAVHGYDLWALLLVWVTGVASAWWVGRVSGSGAAGFLAGSAMIAQPSTFLALTDGTPEYLAFWSTPLLLGLLVGLRTEERARFAVLTGIVATVVALDSPYHAVFTVPMALVCCVGVPIRRLLIVAGVAAVGVGILAAAYYGLPLAGPLENRWQNAVKLTVWWQWEAGRTRAGWDYTYTPAYTPALTMIVCVVLSALRLRHTAVWLSLTLLFLVLALGAAPENASALKVWLGGFGATLGDGIAWFNTHCAPAIVRFPRRWLVPAVLALTTAGGIGLGRLPKEWMRALVAVPAAILAVWTALSSTQYRANLPHYAPPDPAFARWVAEQSGGVALIIPRVRGASRLHQRDELPVFADLGADLSSADTQWLQVLLGKPTMNAPNGLFTLTPRHAETEEVGKFLRDMDDLCTPQTVGTPIAPSATQEPERRAATAKSLVEAGLRWIVADEAAYGTEGMALLRLPFAGVTAEDRHFDDGTGVTVLRLGAK